jgi:hypothetical protein
MTSNWPAGVSRAMHELANAAPAAPSIDEVDGRPVPRHRRTPPWVTVAAIVMVVGGIVGTIAVVGIRRHTSEGGDTVRVFHTRVVSSTTAQLECANQIDNVGKFTTAVVDTWSDRSGRRWKSRIVYPDRSAHELIYFGSAIYPTQAFGRGADHDARVGCIGPNAEAMPLVGGPPFPTFLSIEPELAADELPYVQLYDKIATPLSGTVADDRGRPSKMWELRNEGGTASFGSGDGTQMAVTQVQQWWADPNDAERVTQRRYTDATATLGTATLTETLEADETIDVAASLFSTEGFTVLPTSPRPTLPGPPPSLDTAPPAAGDPATWRLDPAYPVSQSTTSLHVLVSRLGCNSGATGVVNAPNLSVGTNDVRITFRVEHSDGGRCPGNDAVPYTVDLPFPIGGRLVYDGACAEGQPAATTALCDDDKGVRWRP